MSCFLAACSHSFGQTTNEWTNVVSGLWGDAANWSANQPPSTGFTYTEITNGGTKTVTIDGNTSGGALSIDRLRLSATAGSTNTLLLSGLGTGNPLQASHYVAVDLGGIIVLSNSALSSFGLSLDHGAALNITNSLVQQSGSLTFFDILNGSTWLDSGAIDCSGIFAVRIGRSNVAPGDLIIKGGTMLAPLVEVGTIVGALGNVNIDGGTLTASAAITLGYAVNATGAVSVTSGQLIATNDFTYVGRSGFGQLTIDGGSGSFAFLSAGNNADGLVSVNGGQLILKPRTTNDWLQVGNIGNGQLNVTGGTLLLGGELHVGDDSSGLGTGSGTASFTGGQLIATNDTTAIGRYGPGMMTLSNTMAWMTNVSVGRHDGSVGTFTIQNNAQAYLLDALSIARFSNSVGHVFVQGGLLSLTNDLLWVGREGTGDMTISGGTVRAAGAFVAVASVVTDPITLITVTNVPSGTLNLTGGSLVLTSNLLVGTSSISTGQVFMAGGTLTLTSSNSSGLLAVQNGSFTLNQGNLTLDNLVLTNSSGQFIFNGGTLQAKSALVANGQPFVVGDGTQPATLQLLGGTYSFADGLVISSNATVTGCGTIIGSISNSGTLSTNCGTTTIVRITSIAKAGGTATVMFTTVTGASEVLEYKNTLTDATWTAIQPGVVGNGQIMSVSDTNATTRTRFYRVHLQ
jgi:T5SS/PEP-CTERM-associated repeat protein